MSKWSYWEFKVIFVRFQIKIIILFNVTPWWSFMFSLISQKHFLNCKCLPGIITRNSAYDLTKDNQQRRKICDALAVASIVANCAGVESNQNRCLGQREFREFLEDYQEEHLEDEDIIELIQVCLCQVFQIWYQWGNYRAHPVMCVSDQIGSVWGHSEVLPVMCVCQIIQIGSKWGYSSAHQSL